MSRVLPDQELLTPKEVAARLRLGESTVFDAAARGDLPCVQLWKGRRKTLLRFRRADIEKLMAGQPVRTAALPRLNLKKKGAR